MENLKGASEITLTASTKIAPVAILQLVAVESMLVISATIGGANITTPCSAKFSPKLSLT